MQGPENFLTLQIYNYKQNGNLELSATVSTVLTAICLIFLVFLEAGQSRNRTVGAAKGTGVTAQAVRSGWARFLSISGALLMLLFLLLPIATVLLISFAEEGSWTFQILPQRYTFDNYASLVADPRFLGSYFK